MHGFSDQKKGPNGLVDKRRFEKFCLIESSRAFISGSRFSRFLRAVSLGLEEKAMFGIFFFPIFFLVFLFRFPAQFDT